MVTTNHQLKLLALICIFNLVDSRDISQSKTFDSTFICKIAKCQLTQPPEQGAVQSIEQVTTKPSSLETKIDSARSKLLDFPYQISIYERNHWGTEFICGGSIYSELYIITAANCFYKYYQPDQLTSPEFIFIVAGSKILNDVDDGEQVVNITTIISHELYDTKTHINDIALLKLVEPIRFTTSVRSINLPPEGHIAERNETAIVSGWGWWGRNSWSDSKSEVLGFTVVDLISDDDCNYSFYFNYYGYYAFENTSMICTWRGAKETNQLCAKDTGGPLTCYLYPDGEPYLCGIASFGYRCGEPEFPAIFTEVSHYVPWIIKMTT